MLTESTNNLTYEKLSKEEMEQRGILGRLVGVCADFITPTRNGRKYPEQLWENIFNSDIMKERIANGVCFGELGHPADREETDMEKVCICMPQEPKKGPDGKLRAVFDILNTPNGRILKSLCDYGSTLGISSRGSGDLETDFDGQESVNPDTYNCEGFDIVLLPGVKDARLEYVTESLHLNEGAVNPKSKINLETREFNYTMHYGANSQDVYGAVVVIPNGIKLDDGSTIDAAVHCEDINGNVIDFNSIEEAQNWIDTYGDSCVYYIVHGDELHATPEEAYDESRAIELESVDLNRKRYNKTLRQKLQESINSETKENQKIMKESLSNIGIRLDESISIWESLSRTLNETLTPQEKMDAWHNGERRENIKACGDAKLLMYRRICVESGYADEVDKIDAELDRRGIVPPSSGKPSRPVKSKNPTFKFDNEKNQLLILSDEAGENFLIEVIGNINSIPLDSNDCFVIEKSHPQAEKIAQAVLNYVNNDKISESMANDAELGNLYHIEYTYDYYNDWHEEFESGLTGYVNVVADNEQQAIDAAEKWCEEKGSNVEFDYRDFSITNNEHIDVSTIKAIDILSENESFNIDSGVQNAGDSDTAIVDELQEALKLNKKLDEKIVNLQEKLSACYAKEVELEEAIDGYKIRIAKLSNKSKENKALTEKLSVLEKQLKDSNDEILSRKHTLHETMQRDATERKSLQESIESKDNKISRLSEQIKTIEADKSTLLENVDVLNEQLEIARKDNRQLKEKYSKKIDANNQLVEKYKNIAKHAVNNYIDKQATVLGVTSQEIKNRLPESYSFKDIDNVCRSLREYRVNINSLPFDTTLNESINVNVKNISNKTLVKNDTDEISDTDMKLAERFIR